MQEQFLDLNGLKVLVVDNDLDSRVLYTCLLESVGATALTVGSAREAFATLTQFTPDIVISEIALPKEDGYAFIRHLRALEANSDQFLPAIAVSAYVQGGDDLRALAAGFQKWLPKPINIDQLVNLIGQVAQQHKSSDRIKSVNPISLQGMAFIDIASDWAFPRQFQTGT